MVGIAVSFVRARSILLLCIAACWAYSRHLNIEGRKDGRGREGRREEERRDGG